ncbi:DUF3870 domain-containing protein [Psychrilyobacter sp.]|uniref:DUF3870 domain-containing protein n=1 Tax=Psychrilyobacter sp. TaxID=2586924 RepID=UPI0030166919
MIVINKIFVSGYSKVPKRTTILGMYSEIVVVMVIDQKIHKIIKADCSLATNLSNEFVQEILIGQNLKNFQQIENQFNKKYFGAAKKALIAACRICHEKYLQTQKLIV